MLATILIGFVIGVLAKFLYPGRDKLGFIFTTLLGIGGSVLGSWAGQTLGWYGPGQPQAGSSPPLRRRHPCCLQPHDRKTLNRKKAV